MPDAHKNLAISAVATAPSPATSGTSLSVTAAQGSRFPTPPFNATVWPATASPDPANAEIIRCTALTTDTLTIARAQEGTTARTIVVGDLIAAGITAKTLTDVEAGLSRGPLGIGGRTGAFYSAPGGGLGVSYSPFPGYVYLCAIPVGFDISIVSLGIEVITAAATAAVRIGVYADVNGWPSGSPLADSGAISATTTGYKSATLGAALAVKAGQRIWVGAKNDVSGGQATYKNCTPLEDVGPTAYDASFNHSVVMNMGLGAFTALSGLTGSTVQPGRVMVGT